MAAIATAASTGRAAWTNAWYSGWTNGNNAGWMARRYGWDINQALLERDKAAIGDGATAQTFTLWPTFSWLRLVDSRIETIAPYYVNHAAFSSAVSTNGRLAYTSPTGPGGAYLYDPNAYPAYTFSNLCVAAGLSKGRFTRQTSLLSTNKPLWPRKADMEERRQVLLQ